MAIALARQLIEETGELSAWKDIAHKTIDLAISNRFSQAEMASMLGQMSEVAQSAGLDAGLRLRLFRDLGGEFLHRGLNDVGLFFRRAARDLSPSDIEVQRELVGALLAVSGRDAALAEADRCDFSLEGVSRHDFTAEEKLIYTRVCDIAIASPELIVALVRAVDYVVEAKIPGAFMECGVFRGGSSMAMMMALLNRDVRDRDFCMYDTFTGFPLPGEVDVYYDGRSAVEEWHEKKTSDDQSGWLVSTLENTRANVLSTGYPESRIKFVKGLVEETIPASAPECLALLRLDTDFYASTKHELEHLYHRLAPGGVLIIDDYGAFKGAQKAVDEFFQGTARPVFLHRIDSNVRMIIKE
jgi:hypothetical protein